MCDKFHIWSWREEREGKCIRITSLTHIAPYLLPMGGFVDTCVLFIIRFFGGEVVETFVKLTISTPSKYVFLLYTRTTPYLVHWVGHCFGRFFPFVFLWVVEIHCLQMFWDK